MKKAGRMVTLLRANDMKFQIREQYASTVGRRPHKGTVNKKRLKTAA